MEGERQEKMKRRKKEGEEVDEWEKTRKGRVRE
jgi:hypothetical protein